MNPMILIIALLFLSVPFIINKRDEQKGLSKMVLIAVVGLGGLFFEHYVLRNIFALDLAFSPQFIGAEIVKSLILLGFGSRITSYS